MLYGDHPITSFRTSWWSPPCPIGCDIRRRPRPTSPSAGHRTEWGGMGDGNHLLPRSSNAREEGGETSEHGNPTLHATAVAVDTQGTGDREVICRLRTPFGTWSLDQGSDTSYNRSSWNAKLWRNSIAFSQTNLRDSSAPPRTLRTLDDSLTLKDIGSAKKAVWVIIKN